MSAPAVEKPLTVAEACALIDEHLQARARHDEAIVKLRVYIAEQRRDAPKTDRPARSAELTPHQLGVARLLVAGLSRSEMCARLHVVTVSEHLRHIYSKLGVRSREDAIRVLVAMGVTPR